MQIKPAERSELSAQYSTLRPPNNSDLPTLGQVKEKQQMYSMKGVKMYYETPRIVELGRVEEMTFGFSGINPDVIFGGRDIDPA